MDDIVDARRRYVDVLGKRFWLIERLHELFEQNLTWPDEVELLSHWCQSSQLSFSCSVIIDDLDVAGIAVLPSKADAPLVIDTNAVAAGTITLQPFRAIPGWHAEVRQSPRSMEQCQLTLCDPFDRHLPVQARVVCRVDDPHPAVPSSARIA